MLHNNMVNQLASTVELAWPNSNGKHSKVGCHENKMTGPTLDNPDENQKPNHVETTIVPQDLGEKKTTRETAQTNVFNSSPSSQIVGRAAITKEQVRSPSSSSSSVRFKDGWHPICCIIALY